MPPENLRRSVRQRITYGVFKKHFLNRFRGRDNYRINYNEYNEIAGDHASQCRYTALDLDLALMHGNDIVLTSMGISLLKESTDSIYTFTRMERDLLFTIMKENKVFCQLWFRMVKANGRIIKPKLTKALLEALFGMGDRWNVETYQNTLNWARSSEMVENTRRHNKKILWPDSPNKVDELIIKNYFGEDDRREGEPQGLLKHIASTSQKPTQTEENKGDIYRVGHIMYEISHNIHMDTTEIKNEIERLHANNQISKDVYNQLNDSIEALESGADKNTVLSLIAKWAHRARKDREDKNREH